MANIKKHIEFEQVTILIEEARNRALNKVNTELVLLYFNVGEIVSEKVAKSIWGEITVGELASFIQNKFPAFTGFTPMSLN